MCPRPAAKMLPLFIERVGPGVRGENWPPVLAEAVQITAIMTAWVKGTRHSLTNISFVVCDTKVVCFSYRPVAGLVIELLMRFLLLMNHPYTDFSMPNPCPCRAS